MKFICFDDGAISEMISGREFQSIDFKEGQHLISLLKGSQHLFKISGVIVVTINKDGMYVSTPGAWKLKKYLVVDCETSKLFDSLSDSEALMSLQKLLRFCAKIWAGSSSFSPAERMISGSTKSIILPLPLSTSSGFRIAIEREPMKERVSKREMSGRLLLVYKSGKEGANSATEEADTANFKKAFDGLQEVYSDLAVRIDRSRGLSAAGAPTPIGEAVLRPVRQSMESSVFLPYEEWIGRLTQQQLRFVVADPDVPQRLVGAAGTGKTLTLMIRALYALLAAEASGRPLRALFVTHSEATRASLLEALRVTDTKEFHTRDARLEAVSLTVTTLASLCADTLRQSISASEFVDRDAQDSKIIQEMYIEQALSAAKKNEFKSHYPYLSPDFREFIEGQTPEALAPIFQHEISIQIKGRAGDKFDVYKECPRLKYGLPVKNEADRGFVFTVFRAYQEQLNIANQFDTDDVVLSAVGQLDTPIWRRRRAREGFDFILVDETHLFNINELHVFHFFTREIGSAAISFAIDRSQAVGDRGWDANETLALALTDGKADQESSYSTVFRSAPDIVELSATILASGATLFTNFSNNLTVPQSAFTADEERRAQRIRYFEVADDDEMIQMAFKRAVELERATGSKPWEVLITSLSSDVIKLMAEYCEKANKPISFLDRRGDYSRVASAKRAGHMLVGHADYVGGLEFNVVIIAGVDGGRVPDDGISADADSRNFARYTAHNRLYVATSRARFALDFVGVRARGSSDLLKSGFDKGIVERT